MDSTSLPKGLNIYVSKKSDGNMSFVFGNKKEVADNRAKFLESNRHNIGEFSSFKVEHKGRVIEAVDADKSIGMYSNDRLPIADAVATNEKDLGLFLVVADCSPVVFYDEGNSAVCLAHINGKNPEIVNNVVNFMSKKYGSSVESLFVWMGPSILKESFVVPDPFQKKMIEWKNYISDVPDGRTSIDMVGYIVKCMMSAGIQKDNLIVSEVDTYRNKEYFSHRRSVVTGEEEGRFAVAVMIS